MGTGIVHIEREQEIGNKMEMKHKYCQNRKSIRSLCTIILLIFGVLNFLLGLLSVQYSFFDLLMKERIKMLPGPPMNMLENWSHPKLKIRVNVYLYAVENPNEFLAGIDKKLKLKEIGPIVYYQKIRQEDIVHEKNSTLSYTTIRDFEFAEAENEPGIMNKSFIMVNPLMLSLASKFDGLFSAYLFEKSDEIFLNRTVYEALWNSTSKILEAAKSNALINFFLPTDNFGILYNAFRKKPERYNVKIGLENGYKNFWQMNQMNGNRKLPPYEDDDFDECPFSIVNSTDGTGYPPHLSKDTIRLATARVPRPFEFDFDSEVQKGRLKAYKFVMSKRNLIRTNGNHYCLGQVGYNILPSGTLDGSKLAYDMPLALSNPHFYGFSGEWEDYLEGMSPNEEKHLSYLLIEPTTGLQLAGSVSMQSNIPVPDIRYINKLKVFSNKIIPSFWIEQTVTDSGMEFQIYLIVNVLPILQPILAVMFFILSLISVLKMISNLKTNAYINRISRISERSIMFPEIIVNKDLDTEYL